MEHRDHVALIREAFDDVVPGESWADVGAGRGAFTLAAAELLGPGARLFAIDRDATALAANERSMDHAFPTVDLTAIVADLADLQGAEGAGHRLGLPPLDGLVAANVLHFLGPGQRAAIVAALVERLRPDGRFVLVEYETARPTPWLPHPLPWAEWQEVAVAAGLVRPRRTGAHAGASGGGMYAALARRAA